MAPPEGFGFGVTVIPPVPEGVEFNIGNLSVRTALRRGEIVELGQSEVTGGGLEGPVCFIVHWPDNQ